MAILTSTAGAPPCPSPPTRKPRTVILRLLLALALAPGALGGTVSAGAPTREYQIKAIFLFNFVQFVTWPETAFDGPESPIKIGVLGFDPFGPALEAAIAGETVRKRPLEIVRSYRWPDLQHCHLVFISPSERFRLDELLRAFRPLPVVTVSEIPGFTERGGAINFYIEGHKVRFEINPRAARRHDIKLSAQLLSLARIIGPPTGKEN
jgi:hypothetical protein